jgi:hypothetical protein
VKRHRGLSGAGDWDGHFDKSEEEVWRVRSEERRVVTEEEEGGDFQYEKALIISRAVLSLISLSLGTACPVLVSFVAPRAVIC